MSAPSRKVLKKTRKAKSGRPAAGEMAVRKRLVIDTAAELFLKYGYLSTSLDAISRRAGVAKRTLYQQFGDKETIFRTVVAEKNMPRELAVFTLPSQDRTVRGRLMAVATAMIDQFLSKEYISLMQLMVMESRHFPDLMRDVIEASIKILNPGIARVLQDMVDDGLISPLDTRSGADYFYDIVMGNRALRMTLGHDEKRPASRELVERVDLFIVGFLRLRKADARRPNK